VPSPGRFVAIARPDRIVVEEGAGRIGDLVIAEGQQCRLGPSPALEKRSMAADRWKSARLRETVLWRADFGRAKAPPGTRIEGKFVQGGLLTMKYADGNPYFYGGAYIVHDERKLFVTKEHSHLRFRYLLKKRAAFLFAARNNTKDETFEARIDDPVVGAWTTLTLRVADLPENPGGRPGLKTEPGDEFSWLRWSIGEPGREAEILIDDVQVLEIAK
jgi:hypothetical protein